MISLQARSESKGAAPTHDLSRKVFSFAHFPRSVTVRMHIAFDQFCVAGQAHVQSRSVRPRYVGMRRVDEDTRGL